MTYFSIYMQEFEKFYNKICDLALSDANVVTDEIIDECRSKFYALYLSLSSFGLSETELSAFMIVALSKISTDIGAKISAIQKERNKRDGLPDYGLVSILNELCLMEKDFRPGLLLREDSVLNTYLLTNARGVVGDISLDTPLTLKPGIMSWILGEEYTLSEAASVVSAHNPDDTEPIIAHEREIEDLISVFSNMNALSEKGVIHLRGAKGAGKCFMVKAMSKIVNMPLLVVDVKKLLSFDVETMDEMIKRTVQKCFLDGSILYLDFGSEDKYPIVLVQRIISLIQRFWAVVLVGSVGNEMEEISVAGNLHVLNIDNPAKLLQKSYWQYFAGSMGVKFDDALDMDELVSTFDLTPGRIKRSLCCARDMSVFVKEYFVVEKKTLFEEIRKICTGNFTELATLLRTPFEWDDLKASEKTKDLMREAVNRIRYKSVVNEQFGFAKKLPYGQGLSVAFYGPPGTGKTMAATVMAKELGLDIYRIDLSQISSKYIGESEKNLSAVFDSAKYSNAILFFDEADALFARRTDVSSSNDKHANSETAFLLQKMEEYSGICILATNVIQNFDAAFKRRITYMIPVERPTESERLSLWKNVFPSGTPIADDVNFEGYAMASELSGAEIKSAALRAAYFAAAQGRAVSHFDIATAIDEEYKKTGHISILPQLMGNTGKGNW